jgi:hypothetical protein
MGNGIFGLVVLVFVAVLGFAWAARSFGGGQKRATGSSDGGAPGYWFGSNFGGPIAASDREGSSGSHDSGSSFDSDSDSGGGGGGGDGGGGGGGD